ncbi:hypothetical protein VCHA42O253_150060 [Vibrio chagasii]|nr:hypothetical protein VCHA42O253_150060 [Vibrio chagasii]
MLDLGGSIWRAADERAWHEEHEVVRMRVFLQEAPEFRIKGRQSCAVLMIAEIGFNELVLILR